MDRLEALLRDLHSELEFDFVRGSGPGGQNVNKVATTAQLRFDLGRSTRLSADVKQRMIRLAGARVSVDGILIIEGHRYRSQERNRVDAVTRFDALVMRALRPDKLRISTKPSGAARQRRLNAKRKRGELKKERRARPEE